MQKAMDEDQKESGGGGLLRFLPFTTHGTGVEAPSKVVHFHLQKSISNTQPIRVTQMLTSRPNESEILWNFCRYPPDRRITLVENPHFYEYQSPNAYWDGFTTGPMESYQYAENIYVLTNTRRRIFLEFGAGNDSRVFDNVWQTNGIFIFKSICGKLEGELIIRQLLGNRSWEWCHEAHSRPQ
ncbi:hypothetical protein BJV77DRAFT_143985 [Russula vinacea]|nr:hypothetical protein BJV77DRAFT_143985 [Russula vinacea]